VVCFKAAVMGHESCASTAAVAKGEEGRGRAEGNDEADDEAERHEKSRVTPRHSSSEAFSRLIANASDTLVPPDKLKNTHR